MKQFDESITELIAEIDPRKINLSTDLYNFSQIEKMDANKLPFFLRVGKLVNNSISIPALVPFIDSKGMIYLYNSADEYYAKDYMQNLLFELIRKISPNKIDIIIYDPVYLGVPFKPILQNNLDNVIPELITDEQHLISSLQKYIERSRKFIEDMPVHFQTFLDYWQRSNDTQKHYSLFVLNDSNFSRNTIITDLINRITGNTKNNNSFFILSDLDNRKNNFSFFNSEFIIENHTPFYNELKIDLEYDKVKERLYNNISAISQHHTQRPINIETYDIKEGIKFPIGMLKNNKTINFQLGYDKDVYHAIIGGESGSGKSNLLRLIIQQGIAKHSKDELSFLIFDCMGSRDFKDYDNNPNVLVCERSGNILNVVEKLKLIEKEIENRIKLLDEHDAYDIKELIAKGVKVPRWLCILDEFHHLYNVNMKTTDFVENLLVQKVLKGGRKYGIHLLAVTQSLNDGVGASILNNIRLRIALPMNETQSNNFLSHRNSAAKNLEKHHAVYNDQRGEVEGNQIFKITKAS
jgi:hypothetical protein